MTLDCILGAVAGAYLSEGERRRSISGIPCPRYLGIIEEVVVESELAC